MERGGSSNIEHRYTRARPSGIVNRERGVGAPTAFADPTVAANIPAGEVSREQQAAALKREADQYMPIANVTRIMRRVLPTNAKIADDAKEAIQECVSEFISFITAEANGRCHRDYRKTVTPEDVLAAMASLGFDDYLEPLSVFLSKHRAQDHPDRGSTSHLPQFNRRDSGSNGGGWQAAQMVRSPPTSPSEAAAVTPTVGYYTPLAPAAADEVEYGGFTQALNKYILGNPIGGEGSSCGGREFDLFLRSFK